MAEANWYVVHTYSGYENKVKANIDKTIENRHLENEILEVRVPLQDVVEMKNGAIVSMNVLTKIKYVPTGGNHTDKTITLTNKIELEFNKNLDKAADYEAPKSTSTGLSGLGLNNAKFYIL